MKCKECIEYRCEDDYKCHLCHDGDDGMDWINDVDNWEEVYSYHDAFVNKNCQSAFCKKCKTTYYQDYHEGDGGAGGSEWKELEDGTTVKKYEKIDWDHPEKIQERNY